MQDTQVLNQSDIDPAFDIDILFKHIGNYHHKLILRACSFQGPLYHGWIHKDAWKIIISQCAYFEMAPCYTEAGDPLQSPKSELLLSDYGQVSIKSHEAAIYAAIGRLFATEYTHLHHLLSPSHVMQHYRTDPKLSHKVARDAQVTRTMAAGGRFWDPENSEEMNSHPGRLFREQMEVLRCAASLLQKLFGYGDGIERCLECVEDQEYLMGLIYDWHDMVHWRQIRLTIDEEEYPSSYCCFCFDARQMLGGTEELVRYAVDDLALHIFEMHGDKGDEGWRPLPTKGPPSEIFIGHRPGCFRGCEDEMDSELETEQSKEVDSNASTAPSE